MTSRESSIVPAPRMRHARNDAWRGAARQDARPARRLREADSGRAVGAVGRKLLQGRHDGVEHRGGKLGTGQRINSADEGNRRAARCASAALVAIGMPEIARRRVMAAGRRNPIAMHAGVLSVGVLGLVCGVMRFAIRRGDPLHQAGLMTRATESHGHGGSSLRGNRQGQQPDQPRSDEPKHGATLPQYPW